jgi:hypothetical protein
MVAQKNLEVIYSIAFINLKIPKICGHMKVYTFKKNTKNKWAHEGPPLKRAICWDQVT